jgi:hypothetical protein
MATVQRERENRMRETMAITELLRTIDTDQYPFKWGQAQAMAAGELGTHDGLVYWERARLRFIELGGGELPPHVPAVVSCTCRTRSTTSPTAPLRNAASIATITIMGTRRP